MKREGNHLSKIEQPNRKPETKSQGGCMIELNFSNHINGMLVESESTRWHFQSRNIGVTCADSEEDSEVFRFYCLIKGRIWSILKFLLKGKAGR